VLNKIVKRRIKITREPLANAMKIHALAYSETNHPTFNKVVNILNHEDKNFGN